MGPDAAKPLLLNLGCGLDRMRGFVNIDVAPPADVLWDLNKFPYPWNDNSVDYIEANHVLEHLVDWWGAFGECIRILKPGGTLVVRVPHDGSGSATGYRDHRHIITLWSFHGIAGSKSGMNNEARLSSDTVPAWMRSYSLWPERRFAWIAKWFPKVFACMATYLRNVVFEVRFEFVKLPDRGESDGKR